LEVHFTPAPTTKQSHKKPTEKEDTTKQSANLTPTQLSRYRIFMSQAILIFDFANNEESAQQAWHRAQGWKKGFRLGNKLQLKFERTLEDSASEEKPSKSKKKSEAAEDSSRIRLLIRLAFSDHEKLSYTRWLDRIPTEEPFKTVEHEVHHQNEPDFDKTVELFDSLD
jgi:hypothetical protein